MENGKFWRGLWGKLRRLYLVHFRLQYVQEQLKKRRGHCLQCGKCCRFAVKCPHLTEDNKCDIYNLKRPKQCVYFPIDEKDLADVNFECGYYFVED